MTENGTIYTSVKINVDMIPVVLGMLVNDITESKSYGDHNLTAFFIDLYSELRLRMVEEDAKQREAVKAVGESLRDTFGN